jgi:hypothetical protein
VENSIQRRCDGCWRSRVGGNCETYVAGSGLKAETDEPCHTDGEPFLAPGLRNFGWSG